MTATTYQRLVATSVFFSKCLIQIMTAVTVTYADIPNFKIELKQTQHVIWIVEPKAGHTITGKLALPIAYSSRNSIPQFRVLALLAGRLKSII
ncbi:hypothetical protein BDD12DRAFT_40363 [Trichophaea hybrida]|nr:hypothetical protein BDD12DRAFT_40363 [Trichophaea hybrida]